MCVNLVHVHVLAAFSPRADRQVYVSIVSHEENGLVNQVECLELAYAFVTV